MSDATADAGERNTDRDVGDSIVVGECQRIRRLLCKSDLEPQLTLVNVKRDLKAWVDVDQRQERRVRSDWY